MPLDVNIGRGGARRLPTCGPCGPLSVPVPCDILCMSFTASAAVLSPMVPLVGGVDTGGESWASRPETSRTGLYASSSKHRRVTDASNTHSSPFPVSVVVGATVRLCRWGLCSRCPGVGRCLSGV